MQFLYHNKNVQKIMEDSKLLQGKVGNEIGKNIKRRINQLLSVKNFYEYLTVLRYGSPHSLNGELKGCYALSVSPNYRLIVKPNSDNFDMEGFKIVKEIYIEGVVDYHGRKYEWIIP